MASAGRHNADALFVLARARGLSVEKAATEAGISPRTAYRRLADPDFPLRIAEAQREMLRQALGVLADGAVAAARVLRELAAEGPAAVRLGAARAQLQLYAQLRDQQDLVEQVAALARDVAALRNDLKQGAPSGAATE